MNPTRTGLLDILRSMGGRHRGVERCAAAARSRWRICRCRESALRGIEVPAALVPLAIDEFPVLFIAAACAQGETLVSGAQELRVKESDRIAVMSAGLAALGVRTRAAAGRHAHRGARRGPGFGGGEVDSRGDHRVAMAFCVASLRAAGPIRDPRRGQCGDLVSGLRGRARAESACDVRNLRVNRMDDGTRRRHRRALGLRQGHRQPGGGPALWAGLCSIAVRCTAWWPWRPAGGHRPRRWAGLWRAWPRTSISGSAPRPTGEEIVWLGGQDVTGAIRTEAAGNDASRVAALPERPRGAPGAPAALCRAARTGGRRARHGHGGIPQAPVKIFLTASAEERAARRYKQLKEKGVAATLAALSLEIAERDRRDIDARRVASGRQRGRGLAGYDRHASRGSGRTGLGDRPRATDALGRGFEGTGCGFHRIERRFYTATPAGHHGTGARASYQENT